MNSVDKAKVDREYAKLDLGNMTDDQCMMLAGKILNETQVNRETAVYLVKEFDSHIDALDLCDYIKEIIEEAE
jgi:hypothetical protein